MICHLWLLRYAECTITNRSKPSFSVNAESQECKDLYPTVSRLFREGQRYLIPFFSFQGYLELIDELQIQASSSAQDAVCNNIVD